MTVKAWRIVNQKHAATAFSGEGARLFGGRWNSPGTAVVYAAESRSLAILEILVHLDSPDLLKKYLLFEVEFQKPLIETHDHRHLPANWRTYPAPQQTQLIGDDWVQRSTAPILKLPSVLVPEESTYLINPIHPNFAKLKIHPPVSFEFDPRLKR